MLTNTLYVFTIVCFIADFSHGRRYKEFFRNDYTYIEAVNSFYKIHTTRQTWFNAKRECAQEGASLFYPENVDEQNAVMSFRKENQPDIKWVFVGISDLISEGEFETIDGKSVSDVYNNWKSDEPNDKNGDEDCVQQDNAGKMNDCKCSIMYPFICKKSRPLSLERNNSYNIDGQRDKMIFRNDYTYIEAVKTFYKIHPTPKTWYDAKRECAKEGASLFYPENEDEQNAVMSFRNSTQPDIKWVFVGISDLMSEGEFETIDGKSVSEVYNNWKSDEPNDNNGDEDCVEQDNAGKMNDCKCSKKFSFICKKSPLSIELNKSNNKVDKHRDTELLRNDYTYIEAVNNSYKIHTTQKTWFEAKQECAQEGASLFYPENEDEQNAVMSFQNSTQPDIKWVFLGISDLMSEGVFQTIDGKAISEIYNNWKSHEPNDNNGDEDCVEQDNAGKMNDCNCSKKFSFICKKSPLSLGQNNSDRNSNNINENGLIEKGIFRNDYTYIEAVNSFYKIHTTRQTWFNAKRECAQEGASLFYPENVDEQNAVMSFRKENQPDIKWVFVGISDLISEGDFETIDGKSVSEVYNNWKSDEPNDKNGYEDCVQQDNAGKMNDCKCSEMYSFICKKSRILSLERNNSYNIDGQRDKMIFRNDYTYIEAVKTFYKIHPTPQTWLDAKRECAKEGASLFYPENEDEQNAVMSFRNSTQPDIKWVFVGISDLMSEGEFETIDGKSVSEVYNNWKSDEPNDNNGDEDCVEQDNAGKMNDCKCSKKFSFICKKSPLSIELNKSNNKVDGQRDTELSRNDYTYIEAVNCSYMIHTTQKTWFEAKQECAQEGASLFYPENDEEQNAVMSFRNSTQPDIKWVFLGISDLMSEGVFQTIDGKAISEIYNNWKSHEPNDNNGDEDCVQQDNAGKMNDCKCSKKFSFICKKSPLSLEQNNSDSNSNNNNENGLIEKGIFRNDYTYIEAANSFYKIHTTRQTWLNAKRECAQEGASLFYPENVEEQNAVMSFRSRTQPDIKWVFLGISDLIYEGVFETIDGKSISEVYINWKSDEPNGDDDEDCVGQDSTGKMIDCKCSEKFSFFCKKSLSLNWNSICNIDYSFNKDVGKCYKLHKTPLKWTGAYVECRAEKSHLAVVTNRLEADYLAKLTKLASKQRIGEYHQFFRGIYHLGFHYGFKEGWQTVRGTPFTVDDDVWWDNQQPIIDERKQCGSMFYNGRLNSIDCDTKSFFICEHEVDSSKLSEEMFQ